MSDNPKSSTHLSPTVAGAGYWERPLATARISAAGLDRAATVGNLRPRLPITLESHWSASIHKKWLFHG